MNAQPTVEPHLRQRATAPDVARWNTELADATPEAVLAWALEQYGSRLVIASSFGAEDVVLIDMAVRIAPDVRIFTLDTGRLPQETYDVMDTLRRRYQVEFEVLLPDLVSLRDLLRSKGPNSMYHSVEDRRECCHIRKVEPLNRVLSTADAWVTGLRREQSVTRVDVPRVALDIGHDNMVKLNPLVDWSEADVWARIRERSIPYNLLHDQGFPSIGCAPCTRAIKPGEHARAGRWWWESPERKECGLHR